MAATFEGVAELIKQVRALDDDLITKQVNKAAAEVVEDAARPKVPFRSGKLRSSLRSSGTKTAGVVRAGRASVPWAGPVHFGHFDRAQGGFVRPTPFLYDAADERGEQVRKAYARFVEKAIRNF